MAKREKKQPGDHKLAAFQRATATLARCGIDVSAPGFDLSPAFLDAEQRLGGVEMLATYADFVAGRPRTVDEDARVRAVVPLISRCVHRLVEADSRQGACVDASMAVCRMLDQIGIFSVVVKGALSVVFPAPLEPRYFWHFNPPGTAIAAGHAWVFVPPLAIVDVTHTHQGWGPIEAALLRGPVIADGPTTAIPSDVDLFDPVMRGFTATRRGKIERFVRMLGCHSVRMDDVHLKYTACAVGMPDGDLSALQTTIGGEKPSSIFAEIRHDVLAAVASVAANDGP